MPFKLVVVNTTDEAEGTPDVYVFNQDRVTIGRDASNDLSLTDFKRIVSKEHAEIMRSGSAFRIIDLGSKNFTYLNGERLKSNQPHTVQPGDAIRIGQFELTLEMTEAAPEPTYGRAPDADRTVFDASFQNPFEGDVKLLAATLRSIGKIYDEAAPTRRNDALQEALVGTLGSDAGHQAHAVIARSLGGGGGEPASPKSTSFRNQSTQQPSAPARSDTAPPPHSDRASEATPSDGFEPLAPQPPGKAGFDAPSDSDFDRWPPQSPGQDFDPWSAQPPPVSSNRPSPDDSAGGEAMRLYRLLDTMLRVVVKLIGVPWQFRHEFIGQTIMQSEETAFLYEGDPAVIKRRLLDPSVPGEQAQRRLQLLEEALEDVSIHQIALLDGYKASVQAGAQHLLDQIDPEAIEKQVREKNPLHRFLPLLANAEVVKRFKAQVHELRNEDWSATERRTYRPSFIKAYLARMTSLKRKS